MEVDITHEPNWLLFLAQLPAAPSSARVALWRRLRAAGAASALNGAWVLPQAEGHAELFAQLADSVRKQNGSATVFLVQAMSPTEQETLITRFQADRAREYDEFAERSRGFLDEIKEETRLRKFTFAELEEIEDDLNKLSAWFAKIKTRDFFPDARIQKATEQFETCGTALTAFAEEVYAHDGVNAPIECDADPLDANGREHAPKHPGRRQHG